MNKMPIIISYYTKNTPYELVVRRFLLPTVIKWELRYDIQGIDNLGDWHANTGYKSKFILDMLEKHKEDVIFIDADATINKYPVLFAQIPPEFDCACHFLDREKQWGLQNRPKELLSGTMLWRYRPKVLDLLKRWREKVLANPNVWEQKILQRMIDEGEDIKIYDLPVGYTAIAMGNGKPKAYVTDVVILHHQVSRQFRHKKWKKNPKK